MAGEHGPPPTDPYMAAKTLRVLSRRVCEYIAVIKPTTVTGNTTVQSYVDRAEEAAQEVASRFHALRTAVETRRVREIRRAVDNLAMYTMTERGHRRNALTAVSSSGGNGINSTYLKQLQADTKTIRDLVQSLPTVNDLPSGTQENMLRGIMAILRSGGFPGAENLKWEEVIKHAQAQQNGTATAEATAGTTTSAGSTSSTPTPW
jgi:hypothetical protein